ncbi:MAG TPA: SDR family oxidoreductase [Saprospiraceae bacterium]|nr:SDR family oxidoreductase [Saprospiraceae bacterium]
MNLVEAKVLITGGSQGIGYETAGVLKLKGASVCINGRNKESLTKAAKELGVIPIHGDVSNPADAQRMANEAVEAMGGLNVLINNAGYGYFDQLIDIEIEQFNQLFATNVTGVMLMGQACAKYFMKQSNGNIINISSTAGLSGFAGGTAYVASKFAVKGMTECWRAELRPHNIRVMLLNPSEVQTNFVINSGRERKSYNPSKLEAKDIAHTIKSMLEMDNVGFITEATVFATNPKP